MAPRSKKAIYSGYFMSVDNFKKLFVSLKPETAAMSLISHAPKYNNWRWDLPKAERAKVPTIKLIPFPDRDDGTISEEVIEKVFFPVRFVRYTSEEQLVHNDENKLLWEPNEADKAMLDEFVRVVESKGGKLDSTSVAEFGCWKGVHPDYAQG